MSQTDHQCRACSALVEGEEEDWTEAEYKIMVTPQLDQLLLIVHRGSNHCSIEFVMDSLRDMVLELSLCDLNENITRRPRTKFLTAYLQFRDHILP